MARIARVVAPGYAHHVTQRGNRRQETFFSEEDYRAYLDLIWAEYLAAPEDETVLEALRRHEQTGRAPGGESFVETLEAALARHLKPGKPGPKRGENRSY